MFLNSYILVFLMHAILFVYSLAFLHLQFFSVYSPISCTCSFFQCILLFPVLAVSSNRFSYFYTCFLDCRSPDFQHLFSFDFEIIFPLMYS